MTRPVRLIRRVGFSSGHRYWLPNRSEGENRKLFGDWASPYNHGHNYELFVTVEGRIDPAHGMVVNIKDIDDLLRETIVRQFDQKSINDEIPYFKNRSTSLESLLTYIRSQLDHLPQEVHLTELRLQETPLLSAEWSADLSENTMILTRTYEFAASHRLHVPQMSDETNIELFGKCNNPTGHGHNYVVEVSVSGTPDPVTGMIVDLEQLDATIVAEVIDRYDHKNLSVDLPEFQQKNATSEVIAIEIFDRLKDKLPVRLERVRLLETARSIFEVVASTEQ